MKKVYWQRKCIDKESWLMNNDRFWWKTDLQMDNTSCYVAEATENLSILPVYFSCGRRFKERLIAVVVVSPVVGVRGVVVVVQGVVLHRSHLTGLGETSGSDTETENIYHPLQKYLTSYLPADAPWSEVWLRLAVWVSALTHPEHEIIVLISVYVRHWWIFYKDSPTPPGINTEVWQLMENPLNWPISNRIFLHF